MLTQNFNNNNEKMKVPIANEGLCMDMISLIRHLIAQKKIGENYRANGAKRGIMFKLSTVH